TFNGRFYDQLPCVGVQALRPRAYISYIGSVERLYIHVSEYAVVAEHILSFEIGAVTPLVDEDYHLVHAVEDVRRDVEFRRIVASLSVTDVLTVHVDLNVGSGAEEGKYMLILAFQ